MFTIYTNQNFFSLRTVVKNIKNPQMVNFAYAEIPKQKGVRELEVRNGNTEDIIAQVLKVYAETFSQTSSFAQKIKGPTVEDTLKNVYKFVKHNIHYIIDELGVQDIKEPAAIWWSRMCDCKGYAIFTKSILANLNIKSQFKFADYDNTTVFTKVTHVYVIVPKAGGGYITLDGCMPGYNVEKPTSKFILK